MVSFCIFSFIVKIHFEYYHYASNFIPYIIRKHKVFPEIQHKFCIFSVYFKFHSTYYQNTLDFIWRIIQHKLNFIPRIWRMWPKKLFSSQLFFYSDTTSNNSTYVCNWTQDPQEIINFFFTYLDKKFCSAYS
jgi:hypothetical protein